MSEILAVVSYRSSKEDNNFQQPCESQELFSSLELIKQQFETEALVKSNRCLLGEAVEMLVSVINHIFLFCLKGLK